MKGGVRELKPHQVVWGMGTRAEDGFIAVAETQQPAPVEFVRQSEVLDYKPDPVPRMMQINGNIPAESQFEPGDSVWVVGERNDGLLVYGHVETNIPIGVINRRFLGSCVGYVRKRDSS